MKEPITDTLEDGQPIVIYNIEQIEEVIQNAPPLDIGGGGVTATLPDPTPLSGSLNPDGTITVTHAATDTAAQPTRYNFTPLYIIGGLAALFFLSKD